MKEQVQPTTPGKNPNRQNAPAAPSEKNDSRFDKKPGQDEDQSEKAQPSEWQVPGNDTDPGVEMPSRENGTDTEIENPTRRWL